MIKWTKNIIFTIFLCMTFTTVTYASVPNDVIGTPYEEVAARLGILKLMTGDMVGFRPNDVITRAEVTAIIIRAIGMESTAKGGTYSQTFTDVPEDLWSYEYIELAASLGIVNGMGDGTFHPEGKITYAQAAKMMVTMLGYTPAANTKGGYPIGYINVAAEQGVLEHVTGNANDYVSRGNVALMLDNSLDIPMMVKSGSTKKENYVQSGTAGTVEQTILSTKLKIKKVDALIERSNEKDKTIEVKLQSAGEYTQNKTYKVLENVEFTKFDGNEVTLWLNGDNYVLNTEKIDEGDIFYDFIEQVNGDATASNVYEPAKVTSVKMRNSGDAYVLNTGSAQSTTILYNDELADQKAVPFVNCFVKVNKEGNKILRMEVYPMIEAGIILQTSQDSIQYTQGTIGTQRISGLKDKDDVKVYLDLHRAKLEDIEPDMLFDYWESSDRSKMVIVASSQYLKGNLSAIGSNKIKVEKVESDLDRQVYYTLDGVKYETVDTSIKMLGYPVYAYRDPKGLVRYIRYDGSESLTSLYGVVMKAWTEGEDYLRIYALSGTVGENNYVVSLKDSPVSFDTASANVKKEDGSGVYKFTLNNKKEIEKIERLNNSRTVGSITRFYNETPGRFPMSDGESITVTDTILTALIKVNGVFTPKVLKWDELKNKLCESPSILLDFDTTTSLPKLAVITTGWDTIHTDERRIGLVTDVSKMSSDMYSVTVLRRGNNEVYQIYQDDMTKFHIDKNSLMIYYTGMINGGKTIGCLASYDLSGTPDQWVLDNTQWTTKNEKGTIQTLKDIYITLDRADGSSTNAMTINLPDLQVFEFNDSGEFVARELADLRAGDQVWCIYYNTAVRTIIYQK